MFFIGSFKKLNPKNSNWIKFNFSQSSEFDNSLRLELTWFILFLNSLISLKTIVLENLLIFLYKSAQENEIEGFDKFSLKEKENPNE